MKLDIPAYKGLKVNIRERLPTVRNKGIDSNTMSDFK